MGHEQSIEELKGILRETKLKATPARFQVLQILISSDKPLSIQGIMKRLKGEAIDQATVYRTLNTFETAGLADEVDFHHGHVHYEYTDRPHHHHLVCRSCGRVEDIEGCRLSKNEDKVLKQSGFSSVEAHRLEFFGTCASCEGTV
ncbi:MAG: transcriptional repressor [Candidatus Andersenbacteria bacterium]